MKFSIFPTLCNGVFASCIADSVSGSLDRLDLWMLDVVALLDVLDCGCCGW